MDWERRVRPFGCFVKLRQDGIVFRKCLQNGRARPLALLGQSEVYIRMIVLLPNFEVCQLGFVACAKGREGALLRATQSSFSGVLQAIAVIPYNDRGIVCVVIFQQWLEERRHGKVLRLRDSLWNER